MMKRSIANRIAALALALVLAGSLVPGAWAAEGEPEGGGQLTGVTVTPSNLSMKVGERAYVEASAAGLSQDQMEDARIEWSLENNDPERVRIASGRDSWTVEVGLSLIHISSAGTPGLRRGRNDGERQGAVPHGAAGRPPV